jgi:hypothetical protein
MLESSYPIFPDFYQIMFNYDLSNPCPIDPATQYSSKMQFPSFLDTNMRLGSLG